MPTFDRGGGTPKLRCTRPRRSDGRHLQGNAQPPNRPQRWSLSIKNMKLELQTSTWLPLKDVRCVSAPWLIRSTGVLALGRPFRRSEEQVAIAMRLDRVKLVIGHAAGEETGKE